jgi:hypothetical protein
MVEALYIWEIIGGAYFPCHHLIFRLGSGSPEGKLYANISSTVEPQRLLNISPLLKVPPSSYFTTYGMLVPRRKTPAPKTSTSSLYRKSKDRGENQCDWLAIDFAAGI